MKLELALMDRQMQWNRELVYFMDKKKEEKKTYAGILIRENFDFENKLHIM